MLPPCQGLLARKILQRICLSFSYWLVDGTSLQRGPEGTLSLHHRPSVLPQTQQVSDNTSSTFETTESAISFTASSVLGTCPCVQNPRRFHSLYLYIIQPLKASKFQQHNMLECHRNPAAEFDDIHANTPAHGKNQLQEK